MVGEGVVCIARCFEIILYDRVVRGGQLESLSDRWRRKFNTTLFPRLPVRFEE
jgi:hypothetical protein